MAMEVAVTKKAAAEDGQDYSIKPQAAVPSIDTSSWPLLLKNYDKRESLWVFWSPSRSSSDWVAVVGHGSWAHLALRMETSVLTWEICSTCANRPLHPNPQWQLPIEAGHQVVHLIRCYQPR
jgi:hypothetical protein